MKGLGTFTVLALAGLGAARPHDLLHHKHHHHRALITETTYTTVTVADVVVWVDQDGHPYMTSTVLTEVPAAATITTEQSAPTSVQVTVSSSVLSTQAAATSAADVPSQVEPTSFAMQTTVSVEKSTTPSSWVFPSSSAVAEPAASSAAATSSPVQPSSAVEVVSSSAYEAHVSSQIPAPSAAATLVSTPSAEPIASLSKAASPTTTVASQASGSSLPVGIAYDIYTTTCPGGQKSCCKPDDQVAREFAQMKSYSVVRLYGTDCNQVALGLKNAIANGQTLILGIYIPQTSVSDGVTAITDAVHSVTNGNWGAISMITVGNEAVNDQKMTASAVVQALEQARSALRSAGYQGPMGTVDTVPAVVDNPVLCDHSDFALVNCHAFFDPNTAAPNAATFVQGQIEQVKRACGNKPVIVMESGWPYQGDSNGKAVPSKENQQAAIQSLKGSFANDLILFSGFNSPWKGDYAGTFNAEKYWGFL